MAGVAGIIRDITEEKHLQNQLQQAYKMIAIGTLTGGVAHDFNNILGIIIGNTELAMEDVPKWNPAYFCLTDIKTASLRAAGIVKQLLSFSRKTDSRFRPVKIVPVIKDAIKFLRSTIPANITITKNIMTEDINVLTDPVQIHQIMMNLCINAYQEMEETGGTMDVTVKTEVIDKKTTKSYPDLAEGDYISLIVSDTGSGIDPAIYDKIFDPYFTTKDVGKGSGMGLAVVHGIVINHHGKIIVDSNYGKGTAFKILLPVINKKPAEVAETPVEPQPGKEKILLVDDEKPIIDTTGTMLKRLGYRVDVKINPAEALELFKSKPDQFDLIITDMAMPEMTGVELAKKMKRVRSDIPIILCTCHSDLIDEKSASEMGIQAFIMKPIEKKDIAKMIRKVLDN